MADYISCVEASGGNSERIEYEVQNADSGKTGVGVKGSGSGMVVKGSGSVTVDRATEKALASKFEHTWTKVLDPPKSPRKQSTTPAGSNNQIGTTATAPDGFAITGGMVNNPTVNNYASITHRHPLNDKEKVAFQAPLLLQTHSRYDIQIACPAADESVCVYAARFIPLFKDAGWHVGNEASRVTLAQPPDGVRIYSWADHYPPPDAPSNVGVWTFLSPSSVSVYRAFAAIGIEPDSGTRTDMNKKTLAVYFGPERENENQPTVFGNMMSNVAPDYPITQVLVEENGNISGNNNAQRNGNQTSAAAVAPNGIAISGGNVSNPTVNNVTALPDVTMTDSQEKQISDSIGDLFAGADVTVTAVQPDQNTRDVSNRLTRVLQSKGAKVEYDIAQIYIPPAGMTLHKGVSITSFPSERKAGVDTLVAALGDAGVVKFVPICNHRDSKIGIVVNRSAETPEEAKQY
jgi:hypothetical protein